MELTFEQEQLIEAYRACSVDAFECHYCDEAYTDLQAELEDWFIALLNTGLTEDQIYELTDDAIDHATCPF